MDSNVTLSAFALASTEAASYIINGSRNPAESCVGIRLTLNQTPGHVRQTLPTIR